MKLITDRKPSGESILYSVTNIFVYNIYVVLIFVTVLNLTYLILNSNGVNADKYKKKELRKEIIDVVIKLLNSINPYV